VGGGERKDRISGKKGVDPKREVGTFTSLWVLHGKREKKVITTPCAEGKEKKGLAAKTGTGTSSPGGGEPLGGGSLGHHRRGLTFFHFPVPKTALERKKGSEMTGGRPRGRRLPREGGGGRGRGGR